MNSKEYTDDGLLVLDYQSGNKKALPLLVERWHKNFCNRAFWITKDADLSKDVAQESWKIILAKIGDLKDVNSFGSWALTIVYRKSIDYLRAKQKDHRKKREYVVDTVVGESNNDEQAELKKALLKAITELPINHQMVIKLFYVEDYSLNEISDILNISVGTTKSRLFHAREKLKLILKHRTYEN